MRPFYLLTTEPCCSCCISSFCLFNKEKGNLVVHPSGAVSEKNKKWGKQGQREDSFNSLIAFAMLLNLHWWQKFWQCVWCTSLFLTAEKYQLDAVKWLLPCHFFLHYLSQLVMSFEYWLPQVAVACQKGGGEITNCSNGICLSGPWWEKTHGNKKENLWGKQRRMKTRTLTASCFKLSTEITICFP